MKKIIAFAFIGILIMSCSSTKPSTIQEDEMFLTRKYVGNFIEYRYVKPDRFGGQHLILIKTNLESTYGEISAFSKTCKFQSGERLYVRRKCINKGGVWGDWIYKIESGIDNTSYILSQLHLGNKTLVQTWF